MRFTSFVVGAAFLILAAGSARAESAYIREAVQAAVTQAESASDYSGYGAASNSFSLLGGWITKGNELRYSLTLEGGKGYLCVGAGDRDVGDLDIAVSDGTQVIEDDETDNTPWVHVEVEETCKATISLKNFNGTAEGDFCVLIILEEGGAGATGKQLVVAASELAKSVDKAGFQTDHGDGSPSGFCLMGGLFGTGGELGLERGFSEGDYSVVGWGDKNCQDLDLSVTANGEEVCADDDDDSTPVGNFNVDGEARAAMHLKMYKASGNSFGLLAVLKH